MTDLGSLAVAVDIGGTKFAAAVVTGDGKIISRQQVSTPLGADPEELFAALTAVIDVAGAAAGIAAAAAGGMGIATAAPLDLVAGTVSPVNIPGWRGFPLRDRLAEKYGQQPVLIGDAIAVAVGEHWAGAAQRARNVLGMVVSTGVGGGLVIDGRAYLGTGGNAGHIGHVSVDPRGPTCVCGGIGCLEAIASGPRITAWARESGLPAADPAAVAQAAREGNLIARQAFRRAGEAIGLAIAGAVTLLDLDVVVIGGGVVQAGRLLFDPILEGRAKYAGLDFARTPRIVPARLGGDAGLIGAAAMVLRPGTVRHSDESRAKDLRS